MSEEAVPTGKPFWKKKWFILPTAILVLAYIRDSGRASEDKNLA